jgi:AcrR family transcriptional regulator
MYRIGNDKRKTASAKLICGGMNRLLQKCDYEAINITRLIEESGIGRATFYRLFDDKSDVILYQMESVFEDMLTRMGVDTDPDVVISTLFEFWLSQRELFLSLINAGLYEDFQEKLAIIIEKKLSFIKESIELDDRRWHYFIQVRAAMLFAALRVAITQYKDDSAPDIMSVLDFLFGNRQNILRKAKQLEFLA